VTLNHDLLTPKLMHSSLSQSHITSLV